MKMMALADIHQTEAHWNYLLEAVQQKEPDLVIISGDLLPKDNGILPQVSFTPKLKEYAGSIRDAGVELILILGNDDNQLVIPEMETGDDEGLWHYIPDRVKIVKGYEFCGCPWVRDYPFAYKYWVAPGNPDETFIHPVQLGPPAVINRKNEIEVVPNFEEHLKKKRSVAESLESMAAQVEDISSSIWLIHDPPAYMDLDICGSGDKVGSPEVYSFLDEKQPLISVHGHIHEAPEHNGGIWAKKLGRTLCIQAGQFENKLCYVTFELNKGRIENPVHSVYGERGIIL